MIESGKVNDRTFKITDRVKAYYNGKWWTGTIDSFLPTRCRYPKSIYDLALKCGHKLEIVVPESETTFLTYDDYTDLIVQIRTDEKVSEKKSDLFEGFGLWYHFYGPVIFEHEPEYEVLKISVIENEEPLDLPF